MQHTTRRNMLLASGIGFCSLFWGNELPVAFAAMLKESEPGKNELSPPPVKSGETRISQVAWYFQNGTCGTQAIVATYGDQFGISQEMALRFGCGFSGGIGLTGEVCGMVAGAVILLGMKHGPKTVKQRDEYENTVELAKQFVKDFKAKHGSVACRDIIQCDISTPEAYAKAHEDDTFQVCGHCLQTVVDLLENKYDILEKKN